jgi:SpoIIAA-like
VLNISKINNNRIDVEIAGKIDSAQMTKVLDEMFSAIEGMEHGCLLYRVGELEMPTMGAIAVELKYVPKIFQLLRRINRIAVVCDQGWIQTWAEIEGKLIPGLEMKSFDLDDEDEAQEWLGV